MKKRPLLLIVKGRLHLLSIVTNSVGSLVHHIAQGGEEMLEQDFGIRFPRIYT